MDRSSHLTTTVYSHIKDGEFVLAIAILEPILDNQPTSTAALSLLAYCYYAREEYDNAAGMYERLVERCPAAESEQYRLYYAQCLLKTGVLDDADRVVATLQPSDTTETLRAAIKMEEAISQGRDPFWVLLLEMQWHQRQLPSKKATLMMPWEDTLMPSILWAFGPTLLIIRHCATTSYGITIGHWMV